MTRRAGTSVAVPICAAVLFACGGNDDRPDKAQTRAISSPHEQPGAAPTPREQLAAAPVVTCASRNRDAQPLSDPGEGDIVAGPLQLKAVAPLAEIEASEFTPSAGRKFKDIKVLAGVRADQQATLVVGREARDRLTLLYAKPEPKPPFDVEDGGVAVTFRACPATQPEDNPAGVVGPWTTFGGGFLATGPGCFPLEVLTPRRPTPYRLTLQLGAIECG